MLSLAFCGRLLVIVVVMACAVLALLLKWHDEREQRISAEANNKLLSDELRKYKDYARVTGAAELIIEADRSAA